MSYNTILQRENLANEMKTILRSFAENVKNLTYKKGIYIYGSPGCGKTTFILDILKDLQFDIIKYDAGDVRNKSLIDTITSNNISSQNVLSMMQGKAKRIAIVMDEIDGMNNGDKGGITALIKIIRQKKTKKQRLENMTLNPIICIGNYTIDKKIKELMKVCYTFELNTPTHSQIEQILQTQIYDTGYNLMGQASRVPTDKPNHDTLYRSPGSNHTLYRSPGSKYDHDTLYRKITEYIQGDLRKLAFITKIYRTKPELLTLETMDQIFHIKSYNDDAKKITRSLIDRPVPMSQHNRYMNETDRTIVALLWHENIVDSLEKFNVKESFGFYSEILDNMCYADYMDRITFQHQIWSFNEMSSLIKTFYNNQLYHDAFPADKKESGKDLPAEEVRFTKVLTKYSTEYNNLLFIYNLCKELDMDKKDLISFFQELRLYYGKDFYQQPEKMGIVESLLENYNISKLDIKRMYRYLDKNVKKETENIEEYSDEEI